MKSLTPPRPNPQNQLHTTVFLRPSFRLTVDGSQVQVQVSLESRHARPLTPN